MRPFSKCAKLSAPPADSEHDLAGREFAACLRLRLRLRSTVFTLRPLFNAGQPQPQPLHALKHFILVVCALFMSRGRDHTPHQGGLTLPMIQGTLLAQLSRVAELIALQ